MVGGLLPHKNKTGSSCMMNCPFADAIASSGQFFNFPTDAHFPFGSLSF
jgi:hypothetical protein